MFEYEDGTYVVVLQPTAEENRKYNSFLAFEVNTAARAYSLLADGYSGLYME